MTGTRSIFQASSARPSTFEGRYRSYLDESGDHVFREVDKPADCTPWNRGASCETPLRLPLRVIHLRLC
jgi:hypothetical protein